MAPSFVFHPPSGEEFDHSEAEEQEEDDDDEQGKERGGEDEAEDEPISRRRTESPWDLASYSESVADEHARRSTTSVDFKISKLLQKRSASFTPTAADDDESSESESDRQVTLWPYLFCVGWLFSGFANSCVLIFRKIINRKMTMMELVMLLRVSRFLCLLMGLPFMRIRSWSSTCRVH